MSQQQNDLSLKIDEWYEHRADSKSKDQVIGEHQELMAQREVWLSQFGKSPADIYTDEEGEHIMVEVESEGRDGETAYILNRMNLPETIQSKNINL